MQLTSSPRRALGLLAAGTIGLSTALLGVTGVAQAAVTAPTVEIGEGDGVFRVFVNGDDTGSTPESWEYSLDGGTEVPAVIDEDDESGFDAVFEIDGLKNGQEYSVTVRGVDSAAVPGAWSEPVKGTPYTVAGAPGNPAVKVGPASITVSWTAATKGTYDIVGYRVGSYNSFGENGGIDQICETTSAVLTCTATRPAGWGYKVYVSALDSKGYEGAETEPLDQVTIPAPAAPASVPTKNGDLTLPAGAKSTVAPGKTMTVSGSGYAPNSTITLAIYSTPQVLTTVVTDASGNFTATVTVPAGLAAGNHTLVAAGVDSSGNPRYVNLAVTVSGTGKATLAYTGADVALPSIVGLLAVSVGAGLIVVRRRASRSAA